MTTKEVQPRRVAPGKAIPFLWGIELSHAVAAGMKYIGYKASLFGYENYVSTVAAGTFTGTLTGLIAGAYAERRKPEASPSKVRAVATTVASLGAVAFSAAIETKTGLNLLGYEDPGNHIGDTAVGIGMAAASAALTIRSEEVPITPESVDLQIDSSESV